jgi:hypothetical protein
MTLLWPRIKLFVLATAFALMAAGCPKPRPPVVSQPTHDVLAATQPATFSEAVDAQLELDRLRAELQRKDMELAAKLDEAKNANRDTWQRLGAFSWMLVVPGILLLIGSFMPWTSFLAPFRNVAYVLIGLGTLFAILPHMLATYGPWAFYPMAVAAGLYVIALATLNIVGMVRRLKVIEAKAAESHSVAEKALHIGAATGIARVLNPRKDRRFKRGDIGITDLVSIAKGNG